MIPGQARPERTEAFRFIEASLWALFSCPNKTMTLLQFISIFISAALYLGFFWINEWLFSTTALHDGANWIFLPAGLRLLCTLIFAGEGAIGLLIASLMSVFLRNDSMDDLTSIGSALVSAGAPYLAYRAALKFGMPASLEKLSAAGLSLLALMYALTSSFLHSFWFAARGFFPDFLHGWSAMFIGDLAGTMIMVYLLKIILALVRRVRTAA